MPTHPNGRKYSSYVALLRAEERSRRPPSFLRSEIARLSQTGHNAKEISTIVGLGLSTVYYHLDIIRRFSEGSES